ncbi:hypothetical protein ACFQJ7_04325 [Halovenus rubra]|uniref:t-SNARE coiled-coil homology domain-containing protein n=2 Tax=Halovenus rubra TaxID=869890 RepID=A0ABD5X2D2_9EURY|nr:hypothetical protein [Halovenus rubra]
MSDSQTYQELTVASDGVEVVKRFEEEEFPVPAIAFEFTSHRDEEVTVILSDTVPDNIEVEDLGFHPEYGSEHWVIENDTEIAFEREIGAEKSYTTVYGIRATGSDDVEQFLTEPTIEEVEPPLPDDEDPVGDVIPESDDDVVKEAISGDGEIPGLEEPEEGDDSESEDIAKLDLNDPGESEAEQTEATEEETTDSDDDSSEVTSGGATVVEQMAAEIREQEVSAEDVKLLRKAFKMAGDDNGATAAKVDQVQDDVADLRAYTSALEEFLDENGTGQEILNDLESKVETFDSELSTVESSLETNSKQLETVTETVEEFQGDIQSLDDDIETVSNEMDSLSGEVDNVTDQVQTIDDNLSEFEETLGAVESEIEELQETVSDEDVAERVEDIEEEISNLQSWQEQIKQTFGG